MKSRLLLIPMILATTAALGEPADGQARAAALLSRPQTTAVDSDPVRTSSVASSAIDAQASAAALLSRPTTENPPQTHIAVSLPSLASMSSDAQTQAANLLSRSRTS